MSGNDPHGEIAGENIKPYIEELHARQRLRWTILLMFLVLGLILTIILATAIGPVDIPGVTVLKILFHLPGSWSDTEESIVMDVRLPRVLLAALVGSALALAGCAMQGLFRNPMASPYILGVSSGAAFGASLGIILRASYGIAGISVQLMAFVFALVAISLAYLTARENRRVPMGTLLLAGIAVMTFFSAQVSLMKYLAGDELRSIVFWLMGGLWAGGWEDVITVTPLIILGITVIMFHGRELNIMLMGEGHALDLGVDVEGVKKRVLVFSSLITAAAVSVSGIIGFVGLIIPHIMRLIVGPDHRILLPSSCLVGAIYLIWMDTLARSVIQPTELPVGIITASFGAPFFLFLLRKKKRMVGW